MHTQSQITIFVFGSLLCMLSQLCMAEELARPIPDWSYRELEQKSTLIVIVEVVETRDAKESDGVVPFKGLENRVKGVVTRFRVRSALKGSVDSKEITIHHFREIPLNRGYLGNGPCFVDFAPWIIDEKKPESNPSLMLYLRRNEADQDKYVFTSGNEDPIFSVKQIQPVRLGF